jgi:biopolymer transport protein ExbB/TolQ
MNKYYKYNLFLGSGHFAGVTGMLVAIACYVVTRVFDGQFFNNFKVVQKLTEKI